MLFCRYCKVMQTYLGYFGHAWLYATTMIVSTCRRIQFLSVFQKQNSPFTSPLTYYILNNPACQIWDWCWTTILTILVLMLDYFQEKLMTKLFKKYKKTYFVAILVFFAQTWVKMNFPGKRSLSVFKHSNYLPSCQISEKKLMCHSWGK